MSDAIHPQNLHSLYSDHHGWLQGWLRGKLGCSHQAADLAHDTFVRILSKDRELQALREPRAYLSTIARSLVVNHWRRLELERAFAAALAAQPEPLAASAEERYLVIETLQEIDRILSGLPGHVREALLLSQLDGLTYPQIAEQLGLSVNVVQKAMIKGIGHCYAALYP